MKASSCFRLLTCLPALLLTGPVCAQLEGTLFTQPDERVYLDYLRDEFLRNNAESGFDIAVVEIPVIPVEATVTLENGPGEFTYGGIMTRGNGSRSVWLNGRLLTERELPEGVSLVEGGQILSLRIVQDSDIFILRPGQSVNLATGTVIEIPQRQPAPVTEAAPPTDSVEQTVALTEATEASATAPEDAEAADQGATDIGGLAEQITVLSEEEAQELSNTIERKEEEASDVP